jgi:hypothetical protein
MAFGSLVIDAGKATPRFLLASAAQAVVVDDHGPCVGRALFYAKLFNHQSHSLG